MLPGEIIGGNYVVDRVLGEGGMGIVVAASHRTHGTPVAIKVLRRDACDETHTRRFLREVRGASQLQGEHVARVYDFGRHYDGRPYMAMELLDGPDLDTVLGAGRLPSRLAAQYIIQACRGLAEAHALGIVHRDVKPANLMLTRGPHGDPIVKVVDFGIATAARNDTDGDITAAHIVIGSIEYMSPEQLRSAHDLDARSDIWSLGVTLYELLSGRIPFDGDNFAGVAVSIATDDHTPLREAEPALRKIIDRCLEKDPDDRFANVAELAEALAPFAGIAPDTLRMPAVTMSMIAVETMPIARQDAPIRMRSWVAAAATLLVILGISLLAGNSGAATTSITPAAPPPPSVNPALVVEPIVEPSIAEPTAAPIVEPVVEPVVEAVVEGVVEGVVEPVVEIEMPAVDAPVPTARSKRIAKRPAAKKPAGSWTPLHRSKPATRRR